MAIASPPLLGDRPVTVEDYLTLGEGPPYYELYAGDLRVNPPPSTSHQDIAASLLVLLRTSCPPELNVLVAPVDWVIDRHNVCQPDVVVARRTDIGPAHLTAAPLLAIEVLSPSTRRHDLVHKRPSTNAPASPATGSSTSTTPTIRATQPRAPATRPMPPGHLTHVADAAGATPVHVQRPFPLTIVPAQLLT